MKRWLITVLAEDEHDYLADATEVAERAAFSLDDSWILTGDCDDGQPVRFLTTRVLSATGLPESIDALDNAPDPAPVLAAVARRPRRFLRDGHG